jgi:hypothetical protein
VFDAGAVTRVALLVAVLMLAALAPSAQAAYPGRNGKLVFFQADISVILSVTRNGTGGRTVTGGFEGRRSAVFQPDQQPLL